MRMLMPMLLSAVTIAAIATPARAADVDAQEVREAIRQAVKYLKAKQQRPRGNWGEYAGAPGGMTALATLALLNCGEDPRDEHMRRALTYLSTFRAKTTYAVALQTMAFCAADPEAYKAQIAVNARWLELHQVRSGSKKGAWSYPSQRSSSGDPSNSQFALLALHEAHQVGVKIKRSTWQMALDYWLGIQSADGSWRYRPESSSSGSMTCAGIASVVIASGKLEGGDASVSGQAIRCCGRAEQTKARVAIERGTKWLEDHFSVYRNPGVKSWKYYYLYGVERVGRLTGKRFIGSTDWYREGAKAFLDDRKRGRLQRYWIGTGLAENDPVLATSLALLFLSKGQRPVLMAKLKHGAGDDWNQHRQDVANLTRYVEGKWKKRLTWQVINSEKAQVEDLLQTPVLYISGRDDLKLSKRQKTSLRKYIDAGGFIFAENCCGGSGFDKAFRELMQEIFPKSKLRLLPKTHPVWFAEERVDPDHVRPLLGIEACCRTSVVYCPENLSCHWELARSRSGDPYPPEVQKKVQAALSIGINVLAYATNRQLRDKLDVPTSAVDAPEAKSDRGTLYVVKLEHSGGGDEAPNALPNLLRAAGSNLKLRVHSKQRLISIDDKQLFKYHIAFMHGRRSFRLSDKERDALKKFIERGGFLLVDSICASHEFTTAFRREMKRVFPDSELRSIRANDKMFTRYYGGEDIKTVERRNPQLHRPDEPLKATTRKVPPTLEGIRIDDRYGVIFSPYDMSCALENHESLECLGYVRKDAARIGLNVLLYALHQ